VSVYRPHSREVLSFEQLPAISSFTPPKYENIFDRSIAPCQSASARPTSRAAVAYSVGVLTPVTTTTCLRLWPEQLSRLTCQHHQVPYLANFEKASVPHQRHWTGLSVTCPFPRIRCQPSIVATGQIRHESDMKCAQPGFSVSMQLKTFICLVEYLSHP
jgi:hypothetical protein